MSRAIGQKCKPRLNLRQRNAVLRKADKEDKALHAGIAVDESSPILVPAVGIDPDSLPPYEIYSPLDYKDGPEGFIKWCEDLVCIPIYPEGSDIAVWTPIRDLPKDIHPHSGKSYDSIWLNQKEEFRQCLRMVGGRFIYRLIIFCWMRGEGKSLAACLIQLWKFFNWTKQNIVLGANSKEQTKFVHYDIMRDIVRNSPGLLKIIGERNIQEKEMRLRDDKGNVSSTIKPISSFSGIVSNITGYTFSEMFDMKNPKFFTQIDGSIRNIPNALGVIDSTVSKKQHVLYGMYKSFIDRKTKTLYFSYRCSRLGKVEDYWNPNMDQQQLDDYRAKFPLGEFEQYFLNTWGSASEKVFTEDMLEAMNYLGIDGRLAPFNEVIEPIREKQKTLNTIAELRNKNVNSAFLQDYQKVDRITSRLWPVSNMYTLKDPNGSTYKASLTDLLKLGDLFDTDWAILSGIDRADPLKVNIGGARTIVSFIAKGLPGSRSNPFNYTSDKAPEYLYILLHLCHVENSGLEEIKNEIIECELEYEGLDALCGERWGIWDLSVWCQEKDIAFEPIFPSYDKQKSAFSELYGALARGKFKSPPIGVFGSKQEDILKEEASVFYHDSDKHWFGSPEKTDNKGIQDDVMFAIAWTIYGGRMLKPDDFKVRSGKPYFGTFVTQKSALGLY
jgi:hypothetical protein